MASCLFVRGLDWWLLSTHMKVERGGVRVAMTKEIVRLNQEAQETIVMNVKS